MSAKFVGNMAQGIKPGGVRRDQLPHTTCHREHVSGHGFWHEGQSLALKLRFDRAQAVGEPYRTGFEPTELVAFLKPLGSDLKADLDPSEQTSRYFQHRTDGICPVEYWH